MEKRGVIRNRLSAMHIRDFSGLRYGNKTPTDIDAFMDFGGKVFVFIEAKCENAQCATGQRVALERLCDACQAAGIETVLLYASHPVPKYKRCEACGGRVDSPDDDIDYAVLSVIKAYYKETWTPVADGWTTRRLITQFRNDIAMRRDFRLTCIDIGHLKR